MSTIHNNRRSIFRLLFRIFVEKIRDRNHAFCWRKEIENLPENLICDIGLDKETQKIQQEADRKNLSNLIDKERF